MPVANESVEDICRQIQSGSNRTGQGIELPAALGLSSLALFAGSSHLSARVIREQVSQAVPRGWVERRAVLPLTHALGQAEQYVRLFLDNMGSGLVIVGAEGRVRFANQAIIINGLFALMGVIWLVKHFMDKGFDLNLNVVIGIFLILGAIFHKTPITYVKAVNEAIKGAGGIALQFPLYGGIQGIMVS